MSSHCFHAVSLLISLSGCSNGKTAPEKESAVTEESTDTTLLFNGKSLDGWEVTNFGPQGPVTVSGDQIVLGYGRWMHRSNMEESFPKERL